MTKLRWLPGVKPEHLGQPARTDDLFAEAVRREVTENTPAAKLRFFAAAEHARMKACVNAEGFFAAVVCRPELWRNVTGEAEERARAKLRALEASHGEPEDRREPRPRGSASECSVSKLIKAVAAKSSIPQWPRQHREAELVEAA